MTNSGLSFTGLGAPVDMSMLSADLPSRKGVRADIDGADWLPDAFACGWQDPPALCADAIARYRTHRIALTLLDDRSTASIATR